MKSNFNKRAWQTKKVYLMMLAWLFYNLKMQFYYYLTYVKIKFELQLDSGTNCKTLEDDVTSITIEVAEFCPWGYCTFWQIDFWNACSISKYFSKNGIHFSPVLCNKEIFPVVTSVLLFPQIYTLVLPVLALFLFDNWSWIAYFYLFSCSM